MALSIKRVKDNPELANKVNQSIEDKKRGIITQEDEIKFNIKSDDIENLKKHLLDHNNMKIELQSDNSNL